MSWSSRRLVAAAAAALCGWAAALAAPRDFPVGSYGDDARYVVLAKALREQGRYRLLQVPGEPAETMFPPGYPAALALAWSPSASGTANLERSRWVNLVLVGPLAGALALAGATVFGLPAAAGAALGVAGVVAPIVMARWVLPLSEPLCLLLLVTGLVLLAGDGARRWAGVLAVVAAAYVRTVALAFLIGIWVVEWRRGHRRRVAWEAAVTAALLAPWVLWTLAHASDVPPALYGMYGSYRQWYGASLTADPYAVLCLVPARNLWLLLESLGNALTALPAVPAALAAVLGAVVIGAAWAGRRAAPAVLAGLCCYAVIVLMWPYPPLRFVGAVWPLILLAAAAGAARLGRRTAQGVTVLLLALALLGFARRTGLRNAGGTWDWRPFVATIRPLVPAGGVLASSNPALYYLTLGVRGVPNERMRSYRFYRMGFWATAWGLGDDLWAIVRRYHPAAVLVERRGVEGRYAVGSLMRQCPGLLVPLWSTPREEYLFAVRDGVPCSPVPVEH